MDSPTYWYVIVHHSPPQSSRWALSFLPGSHFSSGNHHHFPLNLKVRFALLVLPIHKRQCLRYQDKSLNSRKVIKQTRNYIKYFILLLCIAQWNPTNFHESLKILEPVFVPEASEFPCFLAYLYLGEAVCCTSRILQKNTRKEKDEPRVFLTVLVMMGLFIH